jgi:SAM-dependent methyltransferase
MNPSFWNERFAADEWVYGAAPNAFIADQAARLPEGAAVIELGAGEGRNAVFLAEQGFDVTALDYSAEGLRKTRTLADERGVSVDTIRADVMEWAPERTWDAVVIAFLHLPPEARPALHRRIRQILRPGGVLIAEWFRPEQVTEGYSSGGPPRAEMMLTPDELRADFPEAGIQLLESVETELSEGPHHQGPAAVVRFVWQAPA